MTKQSFPSKNKIKNNTGTFISLQTISDGGSYTSPTVNWNSPDYQNQVSYTSNPWITFPNAMGPFSEKVTQHFEEAP
ncbi:TPA_asm: hypothetical protein GYS95_14580 [Listeria monocytogenes]|nr:hypothetical protein [Listeria monocytogenes]